MPIQASSIEAWRCIDKAMTAMQATKERWCEAEAHRVAGEIALKSPQRDVAKAQAYFEHALTVARAQQAKSWELRAAMSLARLLSDQGKRQTARDLLAPVYDWFTEGFDTSDLRNAKALLGSFIKNKADTGSSQIARERLVRVLGNAAAEPPLASPENYTKSGIPVPAR